MDEKVICQAECAVIGTMVNCPETIGTAIQELAPMDFSQLGCRGLYEAVADLFLSGAPVNELTVLAKAGGDYKAMLDACMGYYRPEDVEYLCRLLMEQSRLRRMRRLAEQIVRSEELDAARVILDRLNATVVLGQQTEVVHIADAARDFLARLRSEDRPKYLSTGLRELDEMLFFERGDMMVLGGYPSAGKTLLSVQMSLHLARDYRVGYYSLETKTKKLVDRLMAHRAQVPLRDIKLRALTEEGWRNVERAVREVSALHWDSVGASGKSVQEIRAHALANRHEVVVVDYLQLIRGKGSNRYDEVTNISKDLHIMAQECNIAVIALAQLSRPQPSKDQAPIPPNMSSFRESGQIEQDADIALLLYPEKLNDNASDRILKIGKNKEGEKQQLILSFDGRRQTMSVRADLAMKFWSGKGKLAKAAARQEPAGQVTLAEAEADPDFPWPEGGDPA